MQGLVIKNTGSWYTVKTNNGDFINCKIKGNFRLKGIRSTNPIAVGDNVDIVLNQEGTAFITHICERRNYIIRKSQNLSKQSHIIAANVDQALLLFAITNPAPSCNMLDRFLISMELRGIPAILCFNKQDLAIADQIRELKDVYGNCGCRLLFISTRNPESMDAVREVLRGRTTVVTGPSGAGKSSLINFLCPEAKMETGELSRKIARGKNTTRHVELLNAGDDTFLVDTPGLEPGTSCV